MHLQLDPAPLRLPYEIVALSVRPAVVYRNFNLYLTWCVTAGGAASMQAAELSFEFLLVHRCRGKTYGTEHHNCGHLACKTRETNE